MKLVKKTAEYSIYKRSDDRYAVRDANKQPVNGDEKVRILLAENLIKVTAPSAPAEPVAEEAAPEPVAEEAAPEPAAEEAAGEASENIAVELAPHFLRGNDRVGVQADWLFRYQSVRLNRAIEEEDETDTELGPEVIGRGGDEELGGGESEGEHDHEPPCRAEARRAGVGAPGAHRGAATCYTMRRTTDSVSSPSSM